MKHETTSPAFFEQMYRQNTDPWNFEGSSYEQDRYASIFDAVDGRRYTRAFEPGCSIGVLTRKLASVCDRVEAIDISATAVARARERCQELLQVHIACGSLPEAIPAGKYDLIVFSEIGYYFEEGQLREVVHRLAEAMEQGGYFLASHWLGTSADHLLSGDTVHQIIQECDLLLPDQARRYAHFRLDRMVRR
jgi:predicted TPR repeat methyltransferase